MHKKSISGLASKNRRIVSIVSSAYQQSSSGNAIISWAPTLPMLWRSIFLALDRLNLENGCAMDRLKFSGDWLIAASTGLSPWSSKCKWTEAEVRCCVKDLRSLASSLSLWYVVAIKWNLHADDCNSHPLCIWLEQIQAGYQTPRSIKRQSFTRTVYGLVRSAVVRFTSAVRPNEHYYNPKRF